MGAAALRVAPHSVSKNSNWIPYNKPREPSSSHAGFLLGSGLQGHLKALKLPKAMQYLKENHPLTSIGILLGLAATYRGTMDISIAKMLSIHVPALLPSPNSMDIPPDVQVAAVMGLGWLYMQSQHRGMTETLLEEIHCSPSSNKDFQRESYALAAGLSLGLITL